MNTKRWLLGGATILAALGILSAACGGDFAIGDDDDGGGRGQAASEGGATDGAAKPGDPGFGSSVASGTGEGEPPPLNAQVDRKVIFDVQMRIEVPDVQASFAEAQRLARNAGGYVESSGLSFRTIGGDSFPFATISLRVPSNRHQDVIASLRAIEGGKVVSEGSSSQEVTEQYTDLQSRLRNLERTEQQYLTLLQQATTITDILTVNDRLDGVRSQIEQIQGRLNVLDNLTEFATVTLTLDPILPARAESNGGGLGQAFRDAWATSLEVVEGVATVGVYAVVAAMWLAPFGLVALAGMAVARRRQRGAPVA